MAYSPKLELLEPVVLKPRASLPLIDYGSRLAHTSWTDVSTLGMSKYWPVHRPSARESS